MPTRKTSKSTKAGLKSVHSKTKQKVSTQNLAGQSEVTEAPVGVNEADVVYAPDLSKILNMRKGRPEYKLSSFEKIAIVQEGISKKALESLKQKAGLDYDQLSEVLNVARTTLLNKKGNEKFNQDVSDKILGLANIYSYGYEVFEERRIFNEWIFRKNKALGGQAPFDILHTSFGREEVKHLIGRIDHGVYS